MECTECKELLDAFAAGELEEDQRMAVASHVEGCADCRREADDYKNISVVLAETAAAPPTADTAFYRSLKRRLDEADVSMGRRTLPIMRWRFAGGVAAAAAAVLVVAAALTPGLWLPPAEAPQEEPPMFRFITAVEPGFAFDGAPFAAPLGQTPQAGGEFVVPTFFLMQNVPVDTLLRGNYVTIEDYELFESRFNELDARLTALENASSPAGDE